jgi:5-methylcytosine-specific restriction protein A
MRSSPGQQRAHPSYLKPSTIPLVIVTGAPGAGKTHYVRQYSQPGDLVLDLDEIILDYAGASTAHPTQAQKDRWLARALERRNHDLLRLSNAEPPWPRAWFIVSEPCATWRQWWQDRLQPEAIVVVTTPYRECLARVSDDPVRASAVRRYFELFALREDDVVVLGTARTIGHDGWPEAVNAAS